MTLVPLFCGQCGATLVKTLVEERERQVCQSCGTIAYRNPLPVASALVTNERREVLLVKRSHEPQRGEWCLPIGFAELGETIAEAALRELREEAGIEASILLLLDVDSEESDYYGDLLIVTYEAQKSGGVEVPGSDAEEAAYFPLDALPPLAFRANVRAVAALREVHREEWAIRASFESLQSGEPAGMLSDAMVALVRDHADEIARLWVADVRANPTTPSYHDADPEQLRRIAVAAILLFGRWLKGDRAEADEEVRGFYRTVGGRRRADGFALAELLSALMLLRKHVWSRARTRGVWQGSLEAYRVLELDRRLVLFFDRAMYHAARGYGSAGLSAVADD
jgi:ADP-ribose pyrophosphatase YjhB (NUDIX family)